MQRTAETVRGFANYYFKNVIQQGESEPIVQDQKKTSYSQYIKTLAPSQSDLSSLKPQSSLHAGSGSSSITPKSRSDSLSTPLLSSEEELRPDGDDIESMSDASSLYEIANDRFEDDEDQDVFLECIDVPETNVAAPQPIVPPFTELKKRWPEARFKNDIMFKYTEEKDAVFQQVMTYTNDPGFQRKYSQFLDAIQTEQWFDTCSQDPEELGYLSLMAYLDQKIDQEDLATIQLIAAAMKEKNQGIIHEFCVTVETSTTIAQTLQKAHYPPFGTAPWGRDPLISPRPDMDRGKVAAVKQKFLVDVQEKSPLKRTFLSYSFNSTKGVMNPQGGLSNQQDFCIEDSLYNHAKKAVGFKSVIESGPNITWTVVMPPLSMSVELSRQLVTHESHPFSDQVLMFGHGDDPDTEVVFQSGKRLVSIGSPLFHIPFIHGCKAGPASLGCTLHDFYHVSLDVGNPYLDRLLTLRQNLCQQWPAPGEDKQQDHEKRKKRFLNNLLDREYYHVCQQPLTASHTFLGMLVHFAFMSQLKPVDLQQIDDMKKNNTLWVVEVLIPSLQKALGKDFNTENFVKIFNEQIAIKKVLFLPIQYVKK
jgi:hypothetical protein